MSELQQQTALDEEVIVSYLQEHPDLLINHPVLLRDLEVSHQSGVATSLIERQVKLLRQQNGQLQQEIRGLLHVARENHKLSDNMHHLALELMECEDRDAVIAILYEVLREQFGIEQVVVLLPHGETEETHAIFEKLMHDSVPYCGQLDEEQRGTLFAGEIEYGASVALLPLGEFGAQGLVALGSSDPNQYHEKMGTHFLVQLSALVSRALQRCGTN